jgi:hypothetical protein
MLFMRDLSRALAVAWLACVVAACSFTTSGSGGPGSTAVASTTNLTPTNGHPSSPQEIDCNGSNAQGNDTCTPSNQQACCSTSSSTGSCQPDSNSCTGWDFQCDEALDCNSGQVCCMNGTTFSCQTSCSGGPATQSCRLNAECGQGNQCVVQDCDNGIFVELCALGSGCTQQ